METALYFPRVIVPETSWFMQVLLYWDSAATIIPEYVSKDRSEERLSSYTADLVQAGLVRLIQPRDVLGVSMKTFDEQFLAFLDAQELPKLSGAGLLISIDWDYLSINLFWDLVSRGLARPRDRNDRQFVVEETTIELFMTYIAGSLRSTDPQLHPVTDSRQSLAALASPVTDSASQLQALRYATIMQALPMPSGLVPAAELASFKDKHCEQLHRLHHYLNGSLVDVAVLDDPVLRQAKTASILQEVTDDVAVLREQMTKRAWPRVVFAGIGGVVASGLITGAAITAGGSALLMGLGISGGVLSMGPAAYQVTDLVRAPRFDTRSPLAYAALAQTL
jgi:hypothetical protein